MFVPLINHFKPLFNFAAEPISSRALNLGMSPKSRVDYLRIMKKLSEGEHFSCEDMVRLHNGESRHVLVKNKCGC